MCLFVSFYYFVYTIHTFSDPSLFVGLFVCLLLHCFLCYSELHHKHTCTLFFFFVTSSLCFTIYTQLRMVFDFLHTILGLLVFLSFFPYNSLYNIPPFSFHFSFLAIYLSGRLSKGEREREKGTSLMPIIMCRLI